MHIEIIQKFDEAYYEEFYSQWLKYRSKNRKWFPVIGTVLIVLGIITFLVNTKYIAWAVGLGFGGLCFYFDQYTEKRSWLKKRKSNKMFNQSVTLIFEEKEVRSIGPFTDVKMNWDFYIEIIETEKGVFLVHENGISTYLQKASFENLSDVKLILNRVKSEGKSV